MSRLKIGDRIKYKYGYGHVGGTEGNVVLMVPAKKKLTNREMNIYAKLKDFAEPSYKSVQGPAGVDRVVFKKDDGSFVICPQDKVRFASIPPVANARNQDLPSWAIIDEVASVDFSQIEPRIAAAEYAPRGWLHHDVRTEGRSVVADAQLSLASIQEARRILLRNAEHHVNPPIVIPDSLHNAFARAAAEQMQSRIDRDLWAAYGGRNNSIPEITATEAIERNREAERRYQERRQIAQNQAERIGDAAWWADEDWS